MSWTDMDLKTFAAGLALGGRFGGAGSAGVSGIGRSIELNAVAGQQAMTAAVADQTAEIGAAVIYATQTKKEDI